MNVKWKIKKKINCTYYYEVFILYSISCNEFSKEKNVILGNGVQVITELLTGPWEYKYFRMTRRVMVPNF